MWTAALVCFLVTIVLTPFVRWVVIKCDITDKPNERRINQKPIASLGGLAIYAGFAVGLFVFPIDKSLIWPLFIGATLIMLTGFLDDLLELKARYKLIGQLFAAVIIVVGGGLSIEFINLPFGGEIHFGIFSIPLTILWVVSITNAINLIDGLDGLAAGVSGIAFFTVCGMAFIMGDSFVMGLAILMIAAILGFLPYNFHPAKIFMGDTGALFLGYVLAVLSIMGFKNVTFISLVVPILILGVPISDTLIAIIRRLINKQPIAMADKSHLHHSLLNVGFTHRQTVILIYAISALFSLFAFIFTMSSLWGSMLLIGILLILIEVLIEILGLIGDTYKPLLRLLQWNKNKID